MSRPPDESPRPDGDVPAFVERHQRGLWRYLRLLGAPAADADDLLQDTFVRFLRRAGPGEATPALLRKIARDLWVDRQRWLRRRRAVEWAAELDAALAATPDDPHGERWLDALAACREALSERPRRALELTYRDGCSRREVARQLGLAPNTVRNLLATTRAALRTCIEARMRIEEER